MGEFPSGQRGQTVNLLSVTSVVRIHLPPPKISGIRVDTGYFFVGVGFEQDGGQQAAKNMPAACFLVRGLESTFPHQKCPVSVWIPDVFSWGWIRTGRRPAGRKKHAGGMFFSPRTRIHLPPPRRSALRFRGKSQSSDWFLLCPLHGAFFSKRKRRFAF